jgi:D-glycero-alpha-D-manno-heptose-7-phosphate kinase
MAWRSLTVTSFVDAPAGSGLGSSSALVVALIKAFSVHVGIEFSNQNIADLACSIERDDLGLLGGRQDQFSAAFGGTNIFRFMRNLTVAEQKYLEQNVARTIELALVACFTGLSRESAHIIAEKNEKIRVHSDETLDLFFDLKTDVIAMSSALLMGNLHHIASVLNEGWARKKQLAPSVSNERIESLHAIAMEAGALGGKVSGAGGGGFMMFIVPPERRCVVIKALKDAGADASPLHLTTNGVEAWETTV